MSDEFERRLLARELKKRDFTDREIAGIVGKSQEWVRRIQQAS